MRRLIFLVLLSLLPIVGGRLLSASVLFRHGDRTPLHTFITDPNPSSSWPQGLGRLTDRGHRQLRELGAFLKKRYSSLLSSQGPVVRSTRKNRTLESARSCIAGLYNRSESRVTLKRPVVIHTEPLTEDDLLQSSKHCPRLYALKKKIFSSKRVTSVLRRHRSFLSWLGTQSGFGANMPFSGASHIRDSLLCARAHNRPVPRWLTKKVWRRLRILKELSWRWRFLTTDMRRLQGGPLLQRVIADFRAVAAKPTDGRLRLFSAHDSNVAALLTSAGLFNGKHPPYACAVLMELHETAGGPIVRFFFRNASSLPPYRLTVPGCSSSCPLRRLRRLLALEMLPERDVRKVCTLPKKPSYSFWFSFVMTIILCAVVVAGLVYLLRKTRATRTPRYSRLATRPDSPS